MPGEWYSPTQPYPTKPPAYARNGVSIDDLIDFTPEMRAEADEDRIEVQARTGVHAARRSARLDGPLATLTLGTASGGTNWPGASYDPETHIVYAYASNSSLTPIGLVPPPPDDART